MIICSQLDKKTRTWTLMGSSNVKKESLEISLFLNYSGCPKTSSIMSDLSKDKKRRSRDKEGKDCLGFGG
jgi:hypothetical protein